MRFIIFLILLGFGLVGCGTKGPLYLPENQYRQPVDAPATAPTAAPASEASPQTHSPETSPVEKPQETK